MAAAINRPEKRPQIDCFLSHTMKPDVSKLSSTMDYIFDLARASFYLCGFPLMYY